jgi:hypothetical protein
MWFHQGTSDCASNPTVFRCAIKYRLDLPVFPAEAPCPQYNRTSDVMSDHAVSACGTSGDRIRRHDLLKDALFAAASAACVAPKKEERNLLQVQGTLLLEWVGIAAKAAQQTSPSRHPCRRHASARPLSALTTPSNEQQS